MIRRDKTYYTAYKDKTYYTVYKPHGGTYGLKQRKIEISTNPLQFYGDCM